jgi:hypothetical protein
MTSSYRLGFFCIFTALAVGVWGFAQRATAIGVIYDEDFTLPTHANSTLILNGTAPDVDANGGTNKWLAYSGYKENGTLATANVSQGAWLPFVPQAGNTYTLSASLTNVGPDGSSVAWYALGFAKALPTAANAELGSAQNRFVEGVTAGRAWMLFRPNNPTSPDNPNVSHIGSLNSGTAVNVNWTDPTLERAEGGDIDMKIVLDTTQATWTADFFAKRSADSLYTEVTSTQNLQVQDILGVGFARTTGSLSGTITRFTLQSVAPVLLPGDVNGDGHVDVLDFNIIRDHLFTNGTRSQGDLTNDGIVDFSDFRAWKSAPPSGAGASVNAAIPEPASALLAMIATVGSLLIGRRRCDIAPRQNL